MTRAEQIEAAARDLLNALYDAEGVRLQPHAVMAAQGYLHRVLARPKDRTISREETLRPALDYAGDAALVLSTGCYIYCPRPPWLRGNVTATLTIAVRDEDVPR